MSRATMPATMTMPGARIYDCEIRHVRREPVRNDFTYRSILWLIDLDRIPRLPGPLRLLAEFRPADHAGDPTLSLRRNVEAYLTDEGTDLHGGQVLMLTAARAFGHVFNPLTVYWCHDPAGNLACVIAEVHNTYGGRHRYLLRPDAAGRAEVDKAFYVSPFYPAAGHYRMSLPEPGDALDLTIRYDPPGAAVFTAVLRGRAVPATPMAVLRRALRQPSPTLLTAARIRAQGVKLYLRGLPITPRPAPSEAPERKCPAMPPGSTPVAPRLACLYRNATKGRDLPVGLRAWDGSTAGPAVAPALVLRSPRALRRLAWAPNELGLAQAYVTGELDVEGDITEGLRRAWDGAAESVSMLRIAAPASLARLLATALRFGAIGPRPAKPASQARVRGGLHTLTRDRAVIAHHYDLSNDFYALLLDSTMAYSSAYWSSAEPGYTLAEAQRDKLDLVCRRLGLAPGMRLLDIGCGWGGLLIYAAEKYSVRGVGLTLSQQQATYIEQQLAQRGVADRVTVRVQHFREFHEPGGFDAAASIEMGEHVGAEAYPIYTRTMHTSLKAGGRALIQQMSRAPGAAPGGGPFIEAFIAPDMHMRPLTDTVSQWRAAGFELLGTESLREDYVRTVAAWRENLEDAWPKAVDLVGEETARVWRLYLAGGQLAFEQARMGVDQILLAKPGTEHNDEH
ncbi:MAG TPA: DUF1365 family protein [Actinocrinis sp.]|jgi:cyclopropane fatty-acyl-phospholipid synthase-like methyltransferase/DUF1365 family protein